MTGDAARASIRIVPAGDAAIVAEFPARIDPGINARASALAAELRRRWSAILRDVVIGYCTVTAYFDPLRVDARWLESEMRSAAAWIGPEAAPRGATVEVPVCYGGEFGPDLEAVADFAGATAADVVAWHADRTYRVYMVGFVPGFAYMATVDPRIAAPRRSSPRTSIPAGSVAIAGGQTGIYPGGTPGGWNIIGRTPLRPFDLSRNPPGLLRPGDDVRFVPIERDVFDRMA